MTTINLQISEEVAYMMRRCLPPKEVFARYWGKFLEETVTDIGRSQ